MIADPTDNCIPVFDLRFLDEENDNTKRVRLRPPEIDWKSLVTPFFQLVSQERGKIEKQPFREKLIQLVIAYDRCCNQQTTISFAAINKIYREMITFRKGRFRKYPETLQFILKHASFGSLFRLHQRRDVSVEHRQYVDKVLAPCLLKSQGEPQFVSNELFKTWFLARLVDTVSWIVLDHLMVNHQTLSEDAVKSLVDVSHQPPQRKVEPLKLAPLIPWPYPKAKTKSLRLPVS